MQVSHWSVDSAATVKLITHAVGATTRDKTLDRAEINGTIRDETGAALGDVAVTLRETKTGFERTVVTAESGRYSAPLMPPGVYVVRTERPGFSGATSDPLVLAVGQALVVNIMMRIAGLTETVSVSAAGDTAPARELLLHVDLLRSLECEPAFQPPKVARGARAFGPIGLPTGPRSLRSHRS